MGTIEKGGIKKRHLKVFRFQKKYINNIDDEDVYLCNNILLKFNGELIRRLNERKNDDFSSIDELRVLKYYGGRVEIKEEKYLNDCKTSEDIIRNIFKKNGKEIDDLDKYFEKVFKESGYNGELNEFLDMFVRNSLENQETSKDVLNFFKTLEDKRFIDISNSGVDNVEECFKYRGVYFSGFDDEFFIAIITNRYKDLILKNYRYIDKEFYEAAQNIKDCNNKAELKEEVEKRKKEGKDIGILGDMIDICVSERITEQSEKIVRVDKDDKIYLFDNRDFYAINKLMLTKDKHCIPIMDFEEDKSEIVNHVYEKFRWEDVIIKKIDDIKVDDKVSRKVFKYVSVDDMSKWEMGDIFCYKNIFFNYRDEKALKIIAQNDPVDIERYSRIVCLDKNLKDHEFYKEYTESPDTTEEERNTYIAFKDADIWKELNIDSMEDKRSLFERLKEKYTTFDSNNYKCFAIVRCMVDPDILDECKNLKILQVDDKFVITDKDDIDNDCNGYEMLYDQGNKLLEILSNIDISRRKDRNKKSTSWRLYKILRKEAIRLENTNRLAAWGKIIFDMGDKESLIDLLNVDNPEDIKENLSDLGIFRSLFRKLEIPKENIYNDDNEINSEPLEFDKFIVRLLENYKNMNELSEFNLYIMKRKYEKILGKPINDYEFAEIIKDTRPIRLLDDRSIFDNQLFIKAKANRYYRTLEGESDFDFTKGSKSLFRWGDILLSLNKKNLGIIIKSEFPDQVEEIKTMNIPVGYIWGYHSEDGCCPDEDFYYSLNKEDGTPFTVAEILNEARNLDLDQETKDFIEILFKVASKGDESESTIYSLDALISNLRGNFVSDDVNKDNIVEAIDEYVELNEKYKDYLETPEIKGPESSYLWGNLLINKEIFCNIFSRCDTRIYLLGYESPDKIEPKAKITVRNEIILNSLLSDSRYSNRILNNGEQAFTKIEVFKKICEGNEVPVIIRKIDNVYSGNASGLEKYLQELTPDDAKWMAERLSDLSESKLKVLLGNTSEDAEKRQKILGPLFPEIRIG